MRKTSLPNWFLFVLVAMIAGFLFIRSEPFFIDENDHLKLITNLSELKFSRDTFSYTATFPFYHFALGLYSRMIGFVSFPSLRLISTIFSFFSVVVFYQIAKEIGPQEATSKTLQYLFFPILFIFFFLVYSDAFSLLLVLLSFYFLNKGEYKTSGTFGLLSVLTRQNNIIWIFFFLLLILTERFKTGINKKKIIKFLCDASVFIFTLAGLAIFVVLNGGFTLSDRGAHPLSIHFANLFFFLLCHFVLFLPLNISNFPVVVKKSFRIFWKRKWIILPIVIFFVFYIFAFEADHPYNQSIQNYFLRNRILSYATGSDLVKSLFFIPIFYSVVSLAVTEFKKKIYYFVYPFIVISLCLSWLVEPRYYLIPFTLFILFKKQKSSFIEYLTIVIFIILSVWIVWGALNQKFFL